MLRAFGAQTGGPQDLAEALPGSSFYWKLIALDRRYDIGDRLEARKGNPPRERVVQDIEVPVDQPRIPDWFLREIPIEPIWLCPCGPRHRCAPGICRRPWPLYPLEPGRTYVNVGFWSAVPEQPGGMEGRANRLIEAKVTEFDGHKSLYSEAYYDRAEFAALYGGAVYTEKEIATTRQRDCWVCTTRQSGGSEA